MFIQYLLIGVLVQIVTFIERFARGVLGIEDIKDVFKSLPEAIVFSVTLLIVVFINVLTWPLVIIAEIYNIVHNQ